MKENFVSDITKMFSKFSPMQKILIGGVTVTSLILLIVLFSLLDTPNFSTLYTNLNPTDANKVVQELKSKKIPYKLEAGGSTIKVPQKDVYTLRLNFASKGIPNSGIVGYEIFDKNTIGMSEFMQKLNYRRALEGELCRTIMEQEGVAAARVHIVFPKKAIFKEDEVKPTASVVIKVKDGYSLTDENILAIQKLVAGSVEKLKPENVTVIDTKGELLSKKREDNSLAFSSSSQYELKHSVENYLRTKAQEILDNVLGPGNAIVQVNADLNFNQVEKTMQLIDPDSQTPISEQTTKTQNIGRNSSDSTANITENSTVNYEVSKTVQKVIEGAGNITKLSVAVVINEKKVEVKKGKKVTYVYKPRSEEELQKLAGIVKNAIGYEAERGDQFSLENIAFEPQLHEDQVVEKLPQPGFFSQRNMDKLINLGIIIFAIIASLFVLKGLLKKVNEEKALVGEVTSGAQPALAGPGGSVLNELNNIQQELSQISAPKKKKVLPMNDLEDEITDEAAMKKYQHEKIANYVAQNPMDAAKLINSWLHEDEY